MSDSKSNVAEFSVSEISFSIKRKMEETFDYVRVRGELGRISKPGSGHIYLDLKDDRAVLSGVVWRGVASKLKIQPEQGLEVIATGKITTFPGQSKYQMVIDAMEPAGAGALMALLEERKKKLAAEGLFSDETKKPLPSLPNVIGVVTSPTGAVIRDILHRISDRFPVHVLVWPVRVQGETSGAEVANGIRGFNDLASNGSIPRPDLLIVARGGGSIEDLWGFNEEAVVRAAAASDIPLISAVGHETDWTLLDLVADQRAPTPTGAAEMAVPVKAELMSLVDDRSRRLGSGVVRFLSGRRTELRAASASLPALQDLLALPRQKFDTLASGLTNALLVGTRAHRTRFVGVSNRLQHDLLSRILSGLHRDLDGTADRKKRAMLVLIDKKRQQHNGFAARLTPSRLLEHVDLGKERFGNLQERLQRASSLRLNKERAELETQSKLLKSLSYKDVLARGYAVIRDDNDKPLRSISSASKGAALSVELADGRFNVIATEGQSKKPPSAKKTKKETANKSKQATLF